MSDHSFAWRPHPWHGLEVGPDPPRRVNVYVEITPFDVIKYEIDKSTGYLRVDRPQRTSSLPPTLYGFVPRTFCGPRVAALSDHGTVGDADPLDICVISERPIGRSEVLLEARVVGGLRMLDRGEVDDKIVSVLVNDAFWHHVEDLSELPKPMIQRLHHYFSTYKKVPGEELDTEIEATYGAAAAHRAVEAAMADYQERFPEAVAAARSEDPSSTSAAGQRT